MNEINKINKINTSRIWDIFEKTITFLSIFGLLYLNYKISTETNLISSIGQDNNFNITSVLNDSTIPVFIFLILGLIYLFKSKISTSKYNNTKLEIFLNKSFLKMSLLEVNSIIHTLLLSSVYAFFM